MLSSFKKSPVEQETIGCYSIFQVGSLSQLDGEGIRYEIVAFLKSIESKKLLSCIDENVSEAISRVIQKYYDGEVNELK